MLVRCEFCDETFKMDRSAFERECQLSIEKAEQLGVILTRDDFPDICPSCSALLSVDDIDFSEETNE